MISHLRFLNSWGFIKFLICFESNKECAKIGQDETFWVRKIRNDFPDVDWKSYNYTSYLELYKRLMLSYGCLLELRPDSDPQQILPGDYLVKKMIVWESSRYFIDKEDNLHWMDEENFHVLFAHVRDFVVTDECAMILDTTGILSIIRGQNSTQLNSRLRSSLLEHISSNVREIGGNECWFYYVTKHDELYVLDIEPYEFGHVDVNSAFRYVNKVKCVCLSGGNFYYVDLNNETFEGFDCDADMTGGVNTRQLFVRDGIYYWLTENGIIDIFDRKMDKFFSFSIGDLVTTKLFFDFQNLSSPVYALTSTLELYDITDYQHNQRPESDFVLDSSLGVCSSYIISIPMTDTTAQRYR